MTGNKRDRVTESVSSINHTNDLTFSDIMMNYRTQYDWSTIRMFMKYYIVPDVTLLVLQYFPIGSYPIFFSPPPFSIDTLTPLDRSILSCPLFPYDLLKFYLLFKKVGPYRNHVFPYSFYPISDPEIFKMYGTFESQFFTIITIPTLCVTRKIVVQWSPFDYLQLLFHKPFSLGTKHRDGYRYHI